MLKIKNSRLTKLVSVILALSMLVGMMPGVVATSAPSPAGVVESLVSGATLADSNTVVYKNTTLNWSAADAATGKYTEGWWLGAKVSAPAEMTEAADFENVKFEKFNGSAWADAKSFWDYQNSDKNTAEALRFVNLWDVVNDQSFAEAALTGSVIKFQYRFDWTADGIYDQYVTVQVEPSTVTLKKADATVYPSAVKGKVEAADGMTVSGNGTNVVTVVQNDSVVLSYADGWAVSEKLLAPSDKAAGATYQYLNGSTWGQAKAADAQVVLNAAVSEAILSSANGQKLTHSWRFDWDGNGTYEQIVKITIDPAKIMLKDANGNTVYPVFGSVVPLNGGAVSGSGDALTLTITETTVNWSVKNEAEGKTSDGWWVGMNVKAPSEYTKDDLKKATYDYTCGNTKKTGVFFWSNKETADTADSHNVNIWMELDADAVKGTANITSTVAFDWNGDGVKDQTVTMTVVPGAKIVLVKEAQNGFGFAEKNPADALVGSTYTNKASGGKGTGKVTYSIVSGNNVADINATTGTLTFKAAGEVDVKATKAADDNYAQASAEYSITAVTANGEFKFKSTPEMEVIFGAPMFTNTASGGVEGGTVTYSVKSGADVATINATTGKITALKAGTAVIEATKTVDGAVVETASYKLVIVKGTQSPVLVSAPERIEFIPEVRNYLTVSGGSGTGAYKYAITNGAENASIDANTGAITTLLNQNATITVTVYKEGDDGYNKSDVVSVNIAIDAVNLNSFKFEDAYPADITFNDNDNKFTNLAIEGNGEGAVTYKVISGAEVADIDEVTGELTIKAAGTVTVEATKAAEGGYDASTATYTLNVLPDDPEFTVDDVNIVYGTAEHQIVVNETLVGDGAYMYSVEGENDIGLNIDETGKITFVDSQAQVGSVTVKVMKAEDSQYNAAEKTFTVTVAYLETDAAPTVTGSTLNESGWFTGDVAINAPEGYTISYYNALSTTDWAASVAYNVEGENDAKVFLKNADGHITDEITVEDIKLDTQAPSKVDISYDNDVITTIVDTLTFNVIKSDTVVLTIEVLDETSGIGELVYYFGEEEHTVPVEEISEDGKYSVTIDAQFRNKVTVKATDVAGRSVETDDNYYVVIDTDSPVLSVSYDYVAAYNERTEADKEFKYSNGDVTVNFAISEDNFDLNSAGPELTVNGEVVASTWVKNEDTGAYDAQVTFSEEGSYELALTYTDVAGNVMDAYSDVVVVIDKTAPVIEVAYEDVDFVEDKYYSKRTATITVTETNFDAASFVADITAVDIDGNAVTTGVDYASYLADINNWTFDGIKYTAAVAFEADANYTVDFSYTDLACNESEDYAADEFTVDNTAPVISAISYEEAVNNWEELVGILTLGIYSYKEELTAKFNIEDATSGVAAEDAIECVFGNAEYVKKQVTYSENGGVAYVEIVVPPQAKGYLTVNAADKAGNSAVELVDKDRISIIDNIAPEISVEYSECVVSEDTYYFETDMAVATLTVTEENFYAEDVKVYLNGSDEITALEWNVDENGNHVAQYSFVGEGVYSFKVEYVDRSKNEMTTYNSPVLIVDTTAPVVSVEYSSEEEVKNGKYYSDKVVATVTVVEHNFDPDKFVADINVSSPEGVAAKIPFTGIFVSDETNPDIHVATMEFAADGIYTFDFDCVDKAGKSSADYEMDELVIDTTAPTNIEITYSESVVDKIIEGLTFGFYEASVNVTVSAEDATSGIDYIELTYDKQNDDVADSYVATFAPIDVEGNEATATFENIPADLRGYFSATVYDMAGNSNAMTHKDEHVIVIDNTNPGIVIEYASADEEPVVVDEQTYFDKSVTATIKIEEANFFEGMEATDAKSKEAEIINNYAVVVERTDDNGTKTETKYVPYVTEAEDDIEFTWNSTGIDHTMDIVIKDDGDYRIIITDKDMSGNDFTDNENSFTSGLFTIDTVSPKLTVEYYVEKTNKTVDETGKEITEVVKEAIDIKKNKYVAQKVFAQITVEEHNFDANDFTTSIKSQNDNGIDSDYIPSLNWETDKNIHTAIIEYANDADYTFSCDFSDIAGNKCNPIYGEDVFTVDTTAPSISVRYDKESKNSSPADVTESGKNQGVTITVTEHNFDAKIFANNLVIEGYDVADVLMSNIEYKVPNNPKPEADIKAYIAKEGNWNTIGNTHTIYFEFVEESNYHFGFKCIDLAGNSVDYHSETPLEFTVDRTAPVAKSITYTQKTNYVKNVILNVLTLGSYTGNFYNGYATVELTATDDISEVTRFDYDYVKALGESNINLDKLTGFIETDIDQKGNVFKATFTIPYSGNVPSGKDQINGTVSFTATDRVLNKSEINNNNGNNESIRVVVDTTNPKINITPGKTNTGSRDNKLYYNKPFTTTVTINEANFDRNAFVFNVNNANNAGRLNWNKNGDLYTATYTLSNDGEYKMNASHTDNSGNTDSITVAQTMVIDQKAPVITVAGLDHESANNQEDISFTLTVKDDNIRPDGIDVKLVSYVKVLKDEADPSAYELKLVEVDLVRSDAQAGSGVYTYTTKEPLATDGYYKLTCKATDLAGNSSSDIAVKPDVSMNETESSINVPEMNFSVNRNGSTFWVETEHTMQGSDEKIVNQLNGAYVNDKVTIVLYESNVDVNGTSQKTVFMLNDGSETKEIELTPDNYQENVAEEDGGGRWFKNIYTLDNSYFEKDGTYSVNIITYDRATNSNVNTTIDAGTISFTVDRTAPVVSANVKSGQSFREDQHWVQFNIEESNLKPDTVVVMLKTDGSDYEKVDVEDLGNNEYRFLLKDGVKFSFEIMAEDLAGNDAEICKIDDIVVSSNIFVLIYANPTYFAIAIGAAVLLVAIITAAIVVKKKKKASK